jgi:hypothetical protein
MMMTNTTTRRKACNKDNVSFTSQMATYYYHGVVEFVIDYFKFHLGIDPEDWSKYLFKDTAKGGKQSAGNMLGT